MKAFLLMTVLGITMLAGACAPYQGWHHGGYCGWNNGQPYNQPPVQQNAPNNGQAAAS